MRIIRIKSKRRTISNKVELLETAVEHSAGLMFWKSGDVLMKLKTESRIGSAIHTLFCLPLIVAWLDKNLNVIEVRKTRPNWFYEPKKPAMYIFETTDLKKRIRPGERFTVQKKR